MKIEEPTTEPCPYKVGDKIEISHGVVVEMTGQYEMDGVYGGVLSHPKGSGRCAGGVHWNVPGQKRKPTWNVKSWKPLTLSPSFLCHCGFHGFIREGKWVGV